MTASLLASFVIFIATGLYELLFGEVAGFLEDKPFIRYSILLVLLLNACYYYYIAAFTEMHSGTRSKLSDASRAEWVVRVVNQTILFALWFLLHFGWGVFVAGMITLYLSYFLWDYLTREYHDGIIHFVLDVVGFFVTAALIIVKPIAASANSASQGGVNVRQPDQMTVGFSLGMIVIFYAVIFGLGIWHCHFNPFAKVYWRRPELH